MQVSLPARIKRIGLTATEKNVETLIFTRSRAANSVVSGVIWPKFDIIQVLIHILVVCKYLRIRSKSTEKK